MELEIEQIREVKDGTHVGVIINVEYRTTPYNYTDVIIEFEEGKKIKAGYPTHVSEDSRLGKLLKLFGVKILEVGTMIDPNKVLVGKPCQFMTMMHETEKGSFPRVVKDSLKPNEEEVQ